MAASTANMVQSKSGKMYESSSPQGKMIVTAATMGKDAGFDSGAPSTDVGPPSDSSKMDMLSTLQAIYEETQESGDTLETIEDHLDEDGNPLDDARKNLKSSNKDKKKSKIAAGIQSAYGGVKSGLGKVKTSLSGKIGLALLGGGLLLLNEYGDEIAGPDGWLTKFLKYMKEDLIPDIKLLYEDLKVWWKVGWAKVTGFFTFLETTFASIGTYMDKFDTDGVPGLSSKEQDALLTDLKTKASSFVSSMLIGMLSSVGTAIFTGALLVSGITLAKSALMKSGLFAATGAIPTAAGGVGAAAALRAAKVGAGGYIAIGLMVAGGIAAMFDAAGRAAAAALDEEEVTGTKASWTTWAASFISGGDEGTWANAFGNLKEKGMMGAGVGVMLGIPFGPAGMLLGGMIGALAGGLFGLVTGKTGADKMKKALDGLDTLVDDTGDTIASHFAGIIAAAKALLPGGETPSDAYQKGSGMNQELNIKNRDAVLAEIENVKAGGYFSNMTSDEMMSKASPASIAKEVARLEEKLAYFDAQIKIQPTLSKEASIAETKTKIAEVKAEIVNLQSSQTGLSDLNTRGLDPRAAYRYYVMDMNRQGIFSGLMTEAEFTKKFKSGEFQNEKIAGIGDEITSAELVLASAEDNLINQQSDLTLIQKALPIKMRDSFKTSKLQAEIAKKKLMLEMKADNAKENKFTTFTSDSSQTNAITNANYIAAGMSARNDFWQEYYMHKNAIGMHSGS